MKNNELGKKILKKKAAAFLFTLSKLFFYCLIFAYSFLFCKLWAQELTPQPLTLTTAQVLKLKTLFPTSVHVEGDETTESPMHLIWRQIPINLILPLNKERILQFSGNVEFGVDRNALPDNVLHIENDNGSVYLTARAPFAPERVAVKLANHSDIILLNLSASSTGDSTPVIIDVAKNKDAAANSLAATVTSVATDATLAPAISYVDLTRFAIQQLYAPKRLLSNPNGLYRTPMRSLQTEPLILDGSVIAEPLASWRGGTYYVTAVLLRNQMHYALSLKPTALCGTWIAAAFFRNPRNVQDNPEQLTKAGTLLDTTTVFLTSIVPFEDALGLCK